jgi:hypothetical protein
MSPTVRDAAALEVAVATLEDAGLVAAGAEVELLVQAAISSAALRHAAVRPALFTRPALFMRDRSSLFTGMQN